MTILGNFGIDNDVEFHAAIVHDSLEGFESKRKTGSSVNGAMIKLIEANIPLRSIQRLFVLKILNFRTGKVTRRG